MLIHTTNDLKNAIRSGPYAWPGGYPLYFITSDGAALSFDAVKENYRIILQSVKHKMRDGWQVVAFEINWEEPDLFCEHSGKRIDSAYCEEDAA
jgi:hypothetical protein